MTVLSLLEYIAQHPNQPHAVAEKLSAEQDEKLHAAFMRKNTVQLRDLLCHGRQMADKTTIFEI